jgi:hypothetical protein
MNLKDAEQVYQYHFERTEAQINSMGDNPQAKNTLITNSYKEVASLSREDFILYHS